jgi:hydrogenase nickel incorporation protein HypB
MVSSVAEGEDKPLKYPLMFRACELVVLNKIDLLPHVDFDVARCLAAARSINPRLRVFQLSARTREGLPAFTDWLATELAATT